jgi:adenylate cyclase class 2
MSYELELKVKVDGHESARSKLAELGAECLGRVLETNHIYDDPDRTLLAGGRGIRIRTCEAEEGGSRLPTLTYKGKRKPGPFKHRREIQVELDDGEAGRAILEKIGFVEAVRFEKWRETWQLGECLVELDEVPYLGCYIEIEGPDEDTIHNARDILGLDDLETVRKNYIALLTDHCKANNLPADLITFGSDDRG